MWAGRQAGAPFPQVSCQPTVPREAGDFAEHFDAVAKAFRDIAAAVSRFQNVLIGYGLDTATLKARFLGAGAKAEQSKIVAVKSNEVWAPRTQTDREPKTPA